jgi:hypothetical protein
MPLPVLFVALIATLLSDTFLKIIHTYKPGKAVFGFEYTDAENKDKDAYYYDRSLFAHTYSTDYSINSCVYQ